MKSCPHVDQVNFWSSFIAKGLKQIQEECSVVSFEACTNSAESRCHSGFIVPVILRGDESLFTQELFAQALVPR